MSVKRTADGDLKPSGLLDGLLSQASRTSSQVMATRRVHGPPSKSADQSQAPEEVIANFLDRMRPIARAKLEAAGPGASVEIEVRIGRLCAPDCAERFAVDPPGSNACVVSQGNAEFRAEVAEQYFRQKTHELGGAPRRSKETTHNLGDSRRMVKPEALGASAGVQTKEKLGQIDMFLPLCDYDVRVGVALESAIVPFEGDAGFAANGASGGSGRTKNRLSYDSGALGDVTDSWQVDATEVTDPGNAKAMVHELEFELKEHATKRWLGPDAEPGDTESAIHELWWLLTKHFLNAEASNAVPNGAGAFGSAALANAFERQVDEAILAACPAADRSRYKAHDHDGLGKFPGTMPVGLGRRHLHELITNSYLASEKTDGVRHLLVVCQGRVVLVDRTRKKFVCAGLKALARVLPERTVLDGELVKHLEHGRYVFMAFDILSNGHSVSDQSFLRRLDALTELLNGGTPVRGTATSDNLGTLWAAKAVPHRRAMLPVFRKMWYQVKRDPARADTGINCVFKLVNTRGPGQPRVYSDRKRRHHTDGIVFCLMNAPYVLGTNPKYFKWKWADLVTIDFLVSRGGENAKQGLALEVGVKGGGVLDVATQVTLSEQCKECVMQLLRERQGKPFVAELGFVVGDGVWRFERIRPDKESGNFIDTALDAFLQLAEGLSEHELQYRLLGGAAHQWEQKRAENGEALVRETIGR